MNEFFHPNRTKVRQKIEFLRHACLGQSLLWAPFACGIPDDEIVIDFRPLLKSKPPIQYNYAKYCPHPTYFRFNLYNFINNISKSESFDLLAYYLLEVKSIGRKWSDKLFFMLASPKIPKDQQNEQTIKLISKFLAKNEPLLRAVRPCVVRLLKQIEPNIYIPALGLNIFSVFDWVDPSLLSYFSQDAITSKNIDSFLMFPSFIQDSKISTVFQSLFVCREPFPQSSKLFDQKPSFTLLNSSILKKRHFIDDLTRKVRNAIAAADIPRARSLLEGFESLGPWAFLLSYGEVVENPLSFSELAEALGDGDIDIFRRFYNDAEFLGEFHELTGVFVRGGDFLDKSVPVLLGDALFDISPEEIARAARRPLFVVSDLVRVRDFGFVCAFRALACVVGREYGRVHEFVSLVDDAEVMEALTTDVFSLLFIPNLDIFIEDALELLAAIRPFASAELAARMGAALARLHAAEKMGRVLCVDALFDREAAFASFLSRGDAEEAAALAEGFPRLEGILALAGRADSLDYRLSHSMEGREELLRSATGASYDSREVIGGIEELREVSKEAERALMSAFSADEDLRLEVPSRYPALARFVSFSNAYRSVGGGDVLSAILCGDRAIDEEELTTLLGENAVEKLLLANNQSPRLVEMLEREAPLAARVLSMEDIGELSPCWKERKSGAEAHSFEEVFREALNGRDADLLSDIRLEFWDEFSSPGVKEELRSSLTLSGFLYVFPEDSSPVTDSLVEAGVSSAVPEAVMDELFARGEFRLALRYAESLSHDNLFFERFSPISSIENLLKLGDAAMRVFLRLPSRSLDRQIELAQAIAGEAGGIDRGDGAFGKLLALTARFPETDFDACVEAAIAEQLSDADLCCVGRLARCIPFLRDPGRASAMLCEAAFRRVEAIRFGDGASEVRAMRLLREALRATKTVQDLTSRRGAFQFQQGVRRVSVIVRVLEGGPPPGVSLAGFSLAGFRENEFGATLCAFADTADRSSLLLEIRALWECDLAGTLLRRATACVALGQPGACLALLDVQRRFGGSPDPESFAELLRTTAFPLPHRVSSAPSHGAHYDVSVSAGEGMVTALGASVEVVFPHARVAEVLGGRGGQLMTAEQAEALTAAVEGFGGLLELTALHVSTGSFSLAREEWDRLPSGLRTPANAVKSIIFPALANGQWGSLWRFVRRNSLAPRFAPVFEMLRAQGLLRTLADIYKRLGELHRSALTLIECNRGMVDFDAKCELTTAAIETLAAEIADGGDESIVEGNQRLMRLLGLQCVFARMCLDDRLPPNGLDILQGGQSAVEMAALALAHHRFNLCLNIADLHPRTLPLVVDRAVDSLNALGPAQIPHLLRDMSERLDAAGCERLAPLVAETVFRRAADRSAVPAFVRANIAGRSLRVTILLRLGFIPAALDEAAAGGRADDVRRVLREAQMARDRESAGRARAVLDKL